MARRLLTAGLLLAALAWCGRAAAKPPDLPLLDKDVLAPQDPLVHVQAAKPSQPNPFPQAAEPTAAAMETPLFYQIRPSTRRMIGACLLFGVHPLLTLTPTADYLDFDADDAPPIPAVFLLPSVEEDHTGSLLIGVGVNSDAGLTGSVEMTPSVVGALGCGTMLKACWRLVPHVVEQSEPEQIHVMPQESLPDDSDESVCPWMRQQQCAPRHDAPFADYDGAPDVLHNLQMLHQAQTMLEKARKLSRSGRVGEAVVLLEQAHDLCPGSHVSEAVQEAAMYLLVPFYCGSPSYDFGAEEESEPPAEKTKEEKVNVAPCEERVGCGRFIPSRIEKEREIEQKLAFPVTVHFDEASLHEVIDDLRAWQSINIYVDKAALDAEEVSLDHPVNLHVENISLRTALKLILKQAHLSYIIKDEVLQITTERAARGKLQRVCYAVADLLEGDLHCPGTPIEMHKTSPEEALMKLITRTICPQDWCEMGGPGTMDFHPLTRSLVVNATADVQEQIADLLSSLQRLHQAGEEQEEHRDANPHQGCKALLKACHAAMDAGHHREAADLAAKAYALDPDQAAADPLVYKMNLAGDDAVPVEITPCLPPVDPDTPAALEQLYRESLRPPTGGAEEQEPPAVEPPHGSFEFGFGLDGSVQMFGQLRHGAAIWHVYLGRCGLAVWASPDGGADPAPEMHLGD